MTSADPTSDATSGPVIQTPYAGSAETLVKRRIGRMIAPATILFCFLMGVAFAFVAPYLLPPFAVPVAILGAIAIWALPATRTAPTQWLTGLFFAFFVLLTAWPNYLAISPPGLPWITMVRLTGFPLVFVLLVCVSVSADFRSRTAEALNAIPWVWRLLVTFAVIQLLSIGLSPSPLFSVQQFIVAQISWTAVFFASCYVFLKPGRAERWAAIFWMVAIWVGVIALIEKHEGHVPWAGHIPSFLKIPDQTVQLSLAGSARAGAYRVQSTFTTPLGLAEYLALATPFVLHFAVARYPWIVRLAAAASMPFILYIVLGSQSRLGMVGFLLTLLSYLLFWAATRWRRDRNSILGPAITLAYPAIFLLGVAATFASGRLRAVVWGNGPQQGSNDDRLWQYQHGLPMVFSHPWGYGIGTSATTLGDVNARGNLTIDTYWLAVALEYGILGFIVYYGMILLAIYYAGKYSLTATPRDRDFGFLVPIAIALINFLAIKSTFAEETNHPVIFMMLGMTVALVYRIQQDRRRTPGASNGSPVNIEVRQVKRAKVRRDRPRIRSLPLA